MYIKTYQNVFKTKTSSNSSFKELSLLISPYTFSEKNCSLVYLFHNPNVTLAMALSTMNRRKNI